MPALFYDFSTYASAVQSSSSVTGCVLLLQASLHLPLRFFLLAAALKPYNQFCNTFYPFKYGLYHEIPIKKHFCFLTKSTNIYIPA